MKESYTVKYRQPGQIFWRKIKNVKGDTFIGGEPVIYTDPTIKKQVVAGITPIVCRSFTTENDEIIYISNDAEVWFSPDRQAIITHQMSREAGQPVQRA